MKKMRLTLLALFVGLVTLTSGQDINEAGAKLNEGISFYTSNDFASAIKSWEQSILICNNIGDEAEGLKNDLKEKLAVAYLRHGLNLYQNKDFDIAIEALKNSNRIAREISDVKTKNYVDTYLPRVYADKGLSLVDNKDYEGALSVCHEALDLNPNCVFAFYTKGIAYKEMGQFDNAIKEFDNAILYGDGIKAAAKKVANAKELAKAMHETKAANELQVDNYIIAHELLTKSLEYSKSSAYTYYLLVLVNNKLKNWNATIESGKIALELGAPDVSSINFEMGKAYEAKNDYSNACIAYRKVTSGPNVDLAKFQIKEVLKCN